MAFSTRRALLHGAIPAVVTLVLAYMYTSGGDAAASRKAGEAAVRPVLFVYAWAFAISWAWQIGRRRQAIAGMVVFAVLGALAVSTMLHRRPLVLSAAERAPLVLDKDLVLRHPVFGFTVPFPGATFESKPELAAMFSAEKDRSTHAYAYADLDQGAALVVSISKQRPMEQRDLEQWFAGVQDGFMAALARTGDLGAARKLTGTAFPAHRRADAHWMMGERGHARFHIWAQREGGNDLVVLVVGFARDGDVLGEVVSGAGPP